MQFTANLPVIGLDLAKSVFQLHIVDVETGEIQRRQVKRAKLTEFFAKCQRSLVAMEACSTSHHWARVIRSLGHEVKATLNKSHLVRGLHVYCNSIWQMKMKQQTLAMAADQGEGFEQYRKLTKRDKFLATMDQIVPWQELCAVIDPHYPKVGRGRPPIGLERMLRMYFVQHWFNLADEACEEALLDSTALRRFVGIDLGSERVPDGTTLLKFRRLLEQHQLGQALFAKVGEVLQARGMKVGTGTIVDATIIAAPSSTKNTDKQRDPDMHQTRKGQQWYFGMKLHIGVDSRTGLAHSATVTAANVHDKHPLPDLLHGNEQRVYGDSAYASQKALISSKAANAKDFTNQRTRKGGLVDEVERAKNRNKSKIRARVEHVFAVVKRLWGFAKVRYRGLEKNATRSFVALGLANIYLARTRLMA